MKIIPVMHCFNNNYSLPASIAFYSLLNKASKDFFYKLYVLHTDISDDNQLKLIKTIAFFNNASLEFINMKNRFENLFSKISEKAHYSKEIFYKFIPASVFPQYDKIIVADVDVVYLDDISSSFFSFSCSEDIVMACHHMSIPKSSWIETFLEQYKVNFSIEEQNKVKISGGYYVFNLDLIRKDKLEQQFLSFAEENTFRVIQPEQDVINICSYPKIRFLPFKNLVCTYIYDIYNQTEIDFEDDYYSKREILEGLTNPIQLHYATHIKPWKNLNCTKADEWYKVLVNTPYLNEWLDNINNQINSKNTNSKCYFKFGKFALVRTRK